MVHEVKKMNSQLFFFNGLEFYQICILALVGILVVIMLIAIISSVEKWREKYTMDFEDEYLLQEETVSCKGEVTPELTGAELHLRMNAQYFDYILNGFTRSLKRLGFKLSFQDGPGWPLTATELDLIARDVDTARQEHLTSRSYDSCGDVDSHMKIGYAQRFLLDLINNCSQLGWKVVPLRPADRRTNA